MRGRMTRLAFVLLLLLLAACQRGRSGESGLPDGPVVRIDSPPSGARVPLGQELRIESSASDRNLIRRVELYINDDLIADDPTPIEEGQHHFRVVQRWVPVEEGQARVVVYAYNVRGERSRPAAILLEVSADLPTATPEVPAPTATEVIEAPTPEPPTATPEPSPAPSVVEGRVSVQAGLNVRAGPDAAAPLIGGLNLNDPVTAIARNQAGDWVKVRFGGDNREGWVAARFVGWQGEIQSLPVE